MKTSKQRLDLSRFGGWKANYSPSWTEANVTTSALWDDTIEHGPNVPAWRTKISKGIDVTTTLLGEEGWVFDSAIGSVTQTTSPGDANYRTHAEGHLLASHLVSPATLVYPPPSLVEQARSLAEIQFSQRFNRYGTQWQSGVFLGELVEVARMLRSPAKSLRQGVDLLYRDLKKIVLSNSRRGGRLTGHALREAIAGTYLEWKFGWSPTIKDVDDAARAFRALASGRTFDMHRFTGEGQASSAVETDAMWQVDTPGFLTDARLRVRIVTKSEAQVTIRGGWKSDRHDGQMPVPMIFGLGLKDVLPTSWGLVPWSFIADYFINLGEVLEAWSLRFVDFAWLNTTERVRVTRTVLPPASYYKFENFPGFPRETRTNIPGFQVVIRKRTSRGPYVNRWDPTPVVKIPGVRGHDGTKWLNIAALLAMGLNPSTGRK